MNKSIILETLKYEKYNIQPHYFLSGDPVCVGNSLIKIEQKTYNVADCFDSLKKLGEEYYINSDYAIELSEKIDELIYKDINNNESNNVIDYYYQNFDTNLYNNISYENNEKLITWLNEYGVQTILSHVYTDFRKIDTNQEKSNLNFDYLTLINKRVEFELLPIINSALSIYFISTIMDKLQSLISSKNKSYSYEKIEEYLTPFPSLYDYYSINCVKIQELTSGKHRRIYERDEYFINILTNYILKLIQILNRFLYESNATNREIITIHMLPKTSKNISNYNELNLIEEKEIYHSVLQICCQKIEQMLTFPRCIKCGIIINYNPFYCPTHLIEYGSHKIKHYKGKNKNDMIKIAQEIKKVENDNTTQTPTINKYIKANIRNKKYDAKRSRKIK